MKFLIYLKKLFSLTIEKVLTNEKHVDLSRSVAIEACRVHASWHQVASCLYLLTQEKLQR